MFKLATFDNRDFDRGAPRWKEVLWYVVRVFIFQSAIPYPSAFKATLLRAFGGAVGERPVIRPRVVITFPWRLRLGDDVWIGEEAQLLSLAIIELHSDVCVSQRAFLCTGSHDPRSEGFDLVVKPITVQSHSWIGAASFVGPGVTVGRGAVVAAGSVVIRDVEEGALVGGNPARKARTLRDQA